MDHAAKVLEVLLQGVTPGVGRRSIFAQLFVAKGFYREELLTTEGTGRGGHNNYVHSVHSVVIFTTEDTEDTEMRDHKIYVHFVVKFTTEGTETRG